MCGSRGTRADLGVRPISAKIKTSAVENVPESDLWAGDWTPKTGPCGLNLALMGVRPTIQQSMNPGRHPYSLRVFLGDCFGGLIAALIAIPYGLAMASLMGLPPVLGIFTSILTAPVTALLGRNPVLIGGTAIATVPFIALAVRSQGLGGAAKVSIVASVIMMGFCVMRLGRHITRVPQAVVTGFSCGIGGMMLISQMDVIMGVDSAVTRSAGSTLAQLAGLAQRIGGVRPAPLLLGVMVMAAATLAARLSPRAPAPLVGVVTAIVVARLFGFHEREI